MKKYFIFLSLITCCPLFAAEEPVSKKLELRMSIPLPNGDFMHLMHNSIKSHIGFYTFNSDGFMKEPSTSAPLEMKYLNPDFENYPVKPRGMTPITGGLLAVVTQLRKSAIGKLEDRLFLYKKNLSGAKTDFACRDLDGQQLHIEVAEIPSQQKLVLTFLSQLDKYTQSTCCYSVPLSFDMSLATFKTIQTVKVVKRETNSPGPDSGEYSSGSDSSCNSGSESSE